LMQFAGLLAACAVTDGAEDRRTNDIELHLPAAARRQGGLLFSARHVGSIGGLSLLDL
jgi:hypothetical protein